MIYRVIIAEDEPHAQRYISGLLENDRQIEVVGIFGNGKDVLTFLEKQDADILFLDIQMPRMNGIELASSLMDKQNIQIIFTTAYNRYAVSAFEANAIDYLLKPFDEARLYQALKRAKYQIDLKAKNELYSKIVGILEDYRQPKDSGIKEFVIKQKGLEYHVSVSEIIAIEAYGVYARLQTEKQLHLYRISLNELEEELPEQFLRIHRSFIINLNVIRQWQYLNNSTFRFTCTNGHSYISGRKYLDRIKSVLKNRRPHH